MYQLLRAVPVCYPGEKTCWGSCPNPQDHCPQANGCAFILNALFILTEAGTTLFGTCLICRSASLELGRVCEKPKNYSDNKLMDAVSAIIKSLVNDRNYEKMVDVSLGQKVDIAALESERSRLLKETERLERMQTSLENSLIALDYSEPTAIRMEASLNKRLTKVFSDLDELQGQIDDVSQKMEQAVETEAIKGQVYDILKSFDVMFDILDNEDKKSLIKALIESIELYPRTNCSGQWIKTIHFKFPMWYNDNNEYGCDVSFDTDGNFLPREKMVETVVCLGGKK